MAVGAKMKRDKLARFVMMGEALVAPGRRVPRWGQDDHDVSVVASALVFKAVLQARAVQRLVEAGAGEAAIPNLRSLLEAFAELDHLLDGSEEAIKAKAAFLFALRDLRDVIAEEPDFADKTQVIGQNIEARSTQDPAAAYVLQGRLNYWPKKGRAALLDEAIKRAFQRVTESDQAGVGKQLYKLLSWDEHHVMAVVHHIDLAPESDTAGALKAFDGLDDLPGFVTQIAVLALGLVLEKYVARFPEVSAGGAL